jgi:hypothetical protein
MSGRLYHVVKRLSWIEGGSPTPEGEWEGGESVAYEPGDTVYMEDLDLESMYHYLEPLDEAGRIALAEARAKAEALARVTAVADFSPSDVEFLKSALDEKRRLYGCELVQDIAGKRDGSEEVLSTRYVPTNPLPGVVYDDNGLPAPWATALQNERREKEREQSELERKHARIRRGGSLGGRRGRETKRDEVARADEELRADVGAYRRDHPSRGRPAIAAALVDKHGREIDHADPTSRKRAIDALIKRIERLEKKSLDT